MNYSTPRSLAPFRPLVSAVAAAGDAGGGPRGEGGLEGDKSHPHLRPTPPPAAQDLQHFSNQSSEEFDGGGGVHPTREHEGHGLEASLCFDTVFSFMRLRMNDVKSPRGRVITD